MHETFYKPVGRHYIGAVGHEAGSWP